MQILGDHAIKLPGGHAVQTWKSPEMTVFECCERLMNVFFSDLHCLERRVSVSSVM